MREYLREHGAYYRLTSDGVDNDAVDAHANENGVGVKKDGPDDHDGTNDAPE